ncbi:MAG: methylenetetrahydrofolate reductase [Coriobacteriia bacterium]|nr:methylenetetrahydrofolate reductase [Coriobacteriia bacterium]
MGRFREKLEVGEFVITGEVAPPRGNNCDRMLAEVKAYASVADAVNITDNQGATLHLSALAASRLTLDTGLVEPVFQQTCRDRNRLALESDLLAASTYGLENFLAVTGDNPHAGDHPQAKGVFDIDSTQLIRVACDLNEGHDMNGNPIDGATDFYVGAAAFPEAEPWDIQKRRIAGKIDAGARFFQTQACMDIEVFARRVLEIKDMGAHVIAGVLLLKSERTINFINNRLAGLMVSDSVAREIISAKDPYETSVRIAIEQAKVLFEVADGIHMMPLGDIETGVGILREAGVVSK